MLLLFCSNLFTLNGCAHTIATVRSNCNEWESPTGRKMTTCSRSHPGRARQQCHVYNVLEKIKTKPDSRKHDVGWLWDNPGTWHGQGGYKAGIVKLEYVSVHSRVLP